MYYLHPMYPKSVITISQILDAAEQQFILHQYDDITMNALAEAANVTKGALYHHFSSKGSLFLAMMERYLATLQKALVVAVACEGSARQRLACLTQIYLQLPLEKQRVIQLVRRDANRFDGAARANLVAAYQRALPEQIEKIVQDGIRQGEIQAGDSRLLSWQYVAIVEVGLSAYARQRLGSTAEMAVYLTRIFFDGVAVKIGRQGNRETGKQGNRS